MNSKDRLPEHQDYQRQSSEELQGLSEIVFVLICLASQVALLSLSYVIYIYIYMCIHVCSRCVCVYIYIYIPSEPG